MLRYCQFQTPNNLTDLLCHVFYFLIWNTLCDMKYQRSTTSYHSLTVVVCC